MCAACFTTAHGFEPDMGMGDVGVSFHPGHCGRCGRPAVVFEQEGAP